MNEITKILAHKINTLFSNPKAVVYKYSRKFKRWLAYIFLGYLPPPHIIDDYNMHWGYTSFVNKTILDLGADYGSTADYFLRRKAQKIIAVEGNASFARQLKNNFRNNDKVVPIELMIKTPSDIAGLICKYKPDIVKVDIEGAEENIINCPDDVLNSVNEWLIECHSHELFQSIKNRFLNLGFKVLRVPYVDYIKRVLYVHGLDNIRVLIAFKVKFDTRQRT